SSSPGPHRSPLQPVEGSGQNELVGQGPGQDEVRYRSTDFAPLEDVIDPQAFYEPTYDNALLRIVTHVVEAESPIFADLLVERVARAHGFQRAGRIIRDRVLSLVRRTFHLEEASDGSAFIWRDEESRSRWSVFRVPAAEADIRSIHQIPLEELRAGARVCKVPEPEVAIARLFGIRRLSIGARERILRALDENGGEQRSSNDPSVSQLG
ncbi:MAG TPA: DUF3320 domain-containing protein, partial [Longimicrobiaceae bacterium]|nr:DUF3320 domain-containing protein [Longimicrobiaceae bacterium]